MPTRWETFSIQFKGGLITNMAPLEQAVNLPGSAVVLKNLEPSIEGGYRKVAGYAKWTEHQVAGTGPVQGLVSVAEDTAIAVRNNIYYTSVGKAAWVMALNLSSDPTNRIRHYTFNFNGTTKVVIVNGVSKPIYYRSDTHAITVDSAAPSDVAGADHVAEHKNRLFFANGPNLVFTAPFNELDYTAGAGAGVINIGDVITGLTVFRNELIIFCQDQIKRLVGSGLSDFRILDITKLSGCVNGDTIQQVGGDVLYLAPDGIRYLSATERNEDFALQRASGQIQNVVNEEFSPNNHLVSLVVRGKAQYRLFKYFTNTTQSYGLLGTRFLDQSAEGIAWANIEGVRPYCADSKQHFSKEEIIFANNTGYVYELEVGSTWDGDSIVTEYKGPPLPITDPRIRKTLYKHTLYTENAGLLNLSCRIILDDEEDYSIVQPDTFLITQDPDTVALYDVALYDAAYYSLGTQKTFTSMVNGSGFTFTLVYSDSEVSSNFALDTVLLEFAQNDRK